MTDTLSKNDKTQEQLEIEYQIKLDRLQATVIRLRKGIQDIIATGKEVGRRAKASPADTVDNIADDLRYAGVPEAEIRKILIKERGKNE